MSLASLQRPTFATAFVAAAILVSVLATRPAVAAPPAEIETAAAALAERYGVRVSPVRTAVRYDLPLAATAEKETVAALDALDRALARYPAAFLKRAGLKEIRLVSGVRMPGARFGGYANPCEGRITVVVSQRDIGATLDHELFHVFDCAFFHRVLRRNHELPHHNVIQTMHDDFEWRDLNKPGFNYTPSLIECKGAASGALEHPHPGFVSWYATCDIAEDKASIFEMLMQDATRAKVLALVERDPILAAKTRLLFSRLRAFGLELPFAIG